MTKKMPSAHKVLLAAIITFAVLCAGVLGLMIFIEKQGGIGTIFSSKLPSAPGITVVPTLRDPLTADSAWCGTMQLVWNDLKSEYVKRDVVFTPQEPMAANLNLGEFTQEMLSEDYYYKTHGPMSMALKNEIEQAIKTKFDQESDVLDQIDWPTQPNDDQVLLYTMLYRKFEYLEKLNKLEKGKFGDYSDVTYFGLKPSDGNRIRDQFEVLYYRSPDDFAILLNTKTNDEVIFHRGAKGSDFTTIYQNLTTQARTYTDNKSLRDKDEFKAPNLTFDVQREYSELAEKVFPTSNPDYPSARINKVLQTIKFSLDEAGGEVKSELVVLMAPTMAMNSSPPTPPRYFNVDDEFVLFLREKNQPLPYLAVRVADITKFQ